ncbi:DNA polymerase IV [Thioalkalivibrio versutus]|uniref:DNA polymerase IV n=1 Tax=Thioalkalivibrio versutus TaxID=106634 RepID=UPI000367E3D0|nr:DNA polymerase IV [Thioalkalivibrio versutus]OOC48761.1 DNA polymerase IV [Thioalkalivibrio versutus]
MKDIGCTVVKAERETRQAFSVDGKYRQREETALSVLDRCIAHLDMDAFFASVELLRYPQLRGQPLVVGGRRIEAPVVGDDGGVQFTRLRDYRGRGVVTTATYEARALGVHSGMGLMTAARRAPDAFLLPADFTAYRHYSGRFKMAVASLAPQIEDCGIDEIYIDLTSYRSGPARIARRIKEAVRAATGLSCSIGIAPNKLLAKMASEFDKPDGLTLVGPADLAGRIWPLKASKINGVGPKSSERLARLGIHTIGDLARAELGSLQEHFGSNYATLLHAAARGRDDRPVVTEAGRKSVSRETTFERDLHPRHDRAQLTETLVALCERVAVDLQALGVRGRTVGIKLRYEDFRTLTRDHTLREPIDEPEGLLAASRECLRRAPLERPLRLLGVHVSALVPVGKGGEDPGPWAQGELAFEE